MANDKFKLTNGRIITPGGILASGCVLVEGGMISYAGPKDIDAEDCAVIDAKGCTISPGFIDIHLHGAGGHDFMDGTEEAFAGAAAALAKHGATGIVPSTLACSDEELSQTITAFNKARAGRQRGPSLLGLHLEGPYFSMEQRGAQDPKFIKTPRRQEYERIAGLSGHILRWSAAPELDGALEMGLYLRERGILPCIAHTEAVYEQVRQAFECGFTHVTHLYSGMSGVRRIGGLRYAGVVESAFLIDGMTVEIIADGMHLPASLLQLIFKIKGPKNIALITDSMRAAGTDVTTSLIGSLRNGQSVVIDNNVAWLPDRTAFAGSVATCDRLVRNMVKLAGASLFDAVTMMTSTPARIVGLDKVTGSIQAGLQADITLFDDEVSVQMTMARGELAYLSDEFRKGQPDFHLADWKPDAN